MADEVWDPGLQNERTRLAWQRTVLSTTACALVTARLVALRSWQLGLGLAVVAVALGLLLGRHVVGRYRVSQRCLEQGQPLPGARAHVGLAVLLVCACVVALCWVGLDWVR